MIDGGRKTRARLPKATLGRGPRLSLLVVLAVTTGACGRGLFSGSSSSSSSSGGGNGTTRSLYVTNMATGKLSALSNTSGTPGNPVTIGAGKTQGPLGLAATSDAVYVANSKDNEIHEFALSSNGNGNLSSLATIAAGANPQQPVVTPGGSFAYAINNGGSISQYSIGTDFSLAANGSTTSGLVSPVSGIASSSFLYVTDPAGGAGKVLSFAINGDGTLASGPSSVSLGTGATNPGQIIMDTSGTWVIVGDATSGFISVLEVSGSGLSLFTQTAPSTSSPAGGLVFALTTAGLPFLYVANPNLDTISMYSFNTGVLTSLGTVAGLSTPNGLAVDSASSALFAVNTGNGTVSGFSISSSSGLLTATANANTESPANSASSPEFIAVNGQSG